MMTAPSGLGYSSSALSVQTGTVSASQDMMHCDVLPFRLQLEASTAPLMGTNPLAPRQPGGGGLPFRTPAPATLDALPVDMAFTPSAYGLESDMPKAVATEIDDGDQDSPVPDAAYVPILSLLTQTPQAPQATALSARSPSAAITADATMQAPIVSPGQNAEQPGSIQSFSRSNAIPADVAISATLPNATALQSEPVAGADAAASTDAASSAKAQAIVPQAGPIVGADKTASAVAASAVAALSARTQDIAPQAGPIVDTDKTASTIEALSAKSEAIAAQAAAASPEPQDDAVGAQIGAGLSTLRADLPRPMLQRRSMPSGEPGRADAADMAAMPKADFDLPRPVAATDASAIVLDSRTGKADSPASTVQPQTPAAQIEVDFAQIMQRADTSVQQPQQAGASAPAMFTPSTPIPLDRQFGAQVGSAIGAAMNAMTVKDGMLLLQIAPEHLGRIEIEIDRGSDRLQITTENESVRSAIAQAHGRIEQELRAAGHRMTAIDVETRDIGTGQNQSQSGMTEQQQQQREQQNAAQQSTLTSAAKRAANSLSQDDAEGGARAPLGRTASNIFYA